jgi:hypothetical protein
MVFSFCGTNTEGKNQDIHVRIECRSGIKMLTVCGSKVSAINRNELLEICYVPGTLCSMRLDVEMREPVACIAKEESRSATNMPNYKTP